MELMELTRSEILEAHPACMPQGSMARTDREQLRYNPEAYRALLGSRESRVALCGSRSLRVVACSLPLGPRYRTLRHTNLASQT